MNMSNVDNAQADNGRFPGDVTPLIARCFEQIQEMAAIVADLRRQLATEVVTRRLTVLDPSGHVAISAAGLEAATEFSLRYGAPGEEIGYTIYAGAEQEGPAEAQVYSVNGLEMRDVVSLSA
jgi:hypothetical protein